MGQLEEESLRLFGRLVRSIRKESGLTQQTFAASLGMSQGQLSKIEKGRAAPNVKALHELSQRYGRDEAGLKALLFQAKGWRGSPRAKATDERMLPVVSAHEAPRWVAAIAHGREPPAFTRSEVITEDREISGIGPRAFWLVASGPGLTGKAAVKTQLVTVGEGDYLMVDPSAKIGRGDLVLGDSNGLALWVWYIEGTRGVLEPLDPTRSGRSYFRPDTRIPGHWIRVTHLRPAVQFL